MMNVLESLKSGIATDSTEAMHALGQKVAAALPTNCTLALHGTLGTGKTTFVQGLAQHWHINTPITSPTFTIMATYPGDRNLIHIDAYRLEGEDPHDALMLDDFLAEPYCLAVEWPQKFASHLLDNAMHLEFTIDKDHKHWVHLKN